MLCNCHRNRNCAHFIGEADRYGGKPLYESRSFISPAKRGWPEPPSSRPDGIRSSQPDAYGEMLRLSGDLPILIEIVDKPERIAELLPDWTR
jgi:PII-like signaling protein